MGQFPRGHKQKQFFTSIKILTNECATFFKRKTNPTNQQLIILFRLENIEMNIYSLLTVTRT